MAKRSIANIRNHGPEAIEPKAIEPKAIEPKILHPFATVAGFEVAQRMAVALAASSMVPPQYQGRDNIGSVLLAMEVAHNTGFPLMTVLQECHMIGGRPVWSAAFQIGLVNRSGLYRTDLDFRFDGEGRDYGCTAFATRHDGTIVIGPRVTMGIAEDEGWINRRGSKWKTIPDLMLRYRAATWFVSSCCPQLRYGVRVADEVIDAEFAEVAEVAEVAEADAGAEAGAGAEAEAEAGAEADAGAGAEAGAEAGADAGAEADAEAGADAGAEADAEAGAGAEAGAEADAGAGPQYTAADVRAMIGDAPDAGAIDLALSLTREDWTGATKARLRNAAAARARALGLRG